MTTRQRRQTRRGAEADSSHAADGDLDLRRMQGRIETARRAAAAARRLVR